MSAEASFVIRAIGGLIAGALIAKGYLSANNSDAFVNSFTDFAGIALMFVSYIYLLHHGYQKVTSLLQNPQSGKTLGFWDSLKVFFVKDTPTIEKPVTPVVPETPVV